MTPPGLEPRVNAYDASTQDSELPSHMVSPLQFHPAELRFVPKSAQNHARNQRERPFAACSLSTDPHCPTGDGTQCFLFSV